MKAIGEFAGFRELRLDVETAIHRHPDSLGRLHRRVGACAFSDRIGIGNVGGFGRIDRFELGGRRGFGSFLREGRLHADYQCKGHCKAGDNPVETENFHRLGTLSCHVIFRTTPTVDHP